MKALVKEYNNLVANFHKQSDRIKLSNKEHESNLDKLKQEFEKQDKELKSNRYRNK